MQLLTVKRPLARKVRLILSDLPLEQVKLILGSSDGIEDDPMDGSQAKDGSKAPRAHFQYTYGIELLSDPAKLNMIRDYSRGYRSKGRDYSTAFPTDKPRYEFTHVEKFLQ